MTRLRQLLAGAVLALAIVPAGAGADGGPSPGVTAGWDGVLARSGLVRYVTVSFGRQTVLEQIRVSDGRVLAFNVIAGSYGVPLVTFDGTTAGLSRDGKLLVLATASGRSGLRPTTRFALVRTKTLGVLRTISLRGDFSFDALSPDARTLYVIEHLQRPNDLTHYLVRAYDLKRGALLAQPVADRAEAGAMAGSPVRRLASADGTWVYTLYQNPGAMPFVHALDAAHRTAVCVDLPLRGNQDRIWSLRLVLAHDGRTALLRWQRGRMFGVVDTAARRVVTSTRS
jgi:hypothetical protein